MESNFTPQHLEAIGAALWTWSVEFLPQLVTAPLILLAGLFVGGRIGRDVARAAFGAVQRALIEGAKRRIDALGDRKPAVKQITRLVPPDNDPSRLIIGGDDHGGSVDLPAAARLPDG